MRDILGPVTIEQLTIPYTAVATDLLTGKSVWFQRGPVDKAIRASIAIPGVIAPHEIDGRLLADGGILDPLPMAPIAAVNADLTIAVSLNGSEPGATRDAEPGITAEWLSRMVRSTTGGGGDRHRSRAGHACPGRPRNRGGQDCPTRDRGLVGTQHQEPRHRRRFAAALRAPGFC